jgi:DNA (cytosine-5)-methyltransferase 1
MWASPDCTHHSRAKGSAPTRDIQRRALADVLVDRWIPALHPRRIILENVPEFKDWGPLDNGKIIAHLKGTLWERFLGRLEELGYHFEHRCLVSADYDTPTTRKRLYLQAALKDEPILWPDPTNGIGLKTYRTAADVIDFSLPCPSIFLTKDEAKKQGLNVVRPLADATLRRIAYGLKRFVLEAKEPFIVGDSAYFLPSMGYGDGKNPRSRSVCAPLSTITAGGQKQALVQCRMVPFIQHVQHSSQPYGVMPADKPMRTITASPKGGGMALVVAYIAKFRGQNIGQPVDAPLQTISTSGGHHALVKASLINHGTITAKNGHFALVTILGTQYAIIDIGLRMLTPKELFLAQGFPSDYIFDHMRMPDGSVRHLTKVEQVRLCGNSVCPPVAKALLEQYSGVTV